MQQGSGVRHRGYRHGRTNRVRFELTESQRYRAIDPVTGEQAADPCVYELLMAECERFGVSPSRDVAGTLVFRVTLGQSRELIEAAGQLGLAPVVERGKSINFRTTVEEYEMLAAAGAKVGLSPTGFAAIAALEGAALELGHRRRRRRVKDFEALRQMVVEVQLATNQVSRAGVRLSQAVAKLNAEGVAPPWLEDAAKKTVKRVEAQDVLVFELGGLLREVLH